MELKKGSYKTYHKFIMFCFVGGIATFLDLLFFNFMFGYTQLFIFSRISGIAFSMIWNFTANKYMTFQAKEGKTAPQLMKYFIVYGIAMGLNVLVSWTAFLIIGPGQLEANIAAVLGLLISIPTSFFGSLLWTFRTKTLINK